MIPGYASAGCFSRAATWARCEKVSKRVRQIAEGAALATSTKVEIERFQNEVKDFVLNSTLDAVIKEELTALGENVTEGNKKPTGSTDAGNISHVVPAAHPYIKIGPDSLVGHTDEFREAAKSEKADRALLTGAKALALTGHRLLTDAVLLKRVREDFEKAKLNAQASV